MSSGLSKEFSIASKYISPLTCVNENLNKKYYKNDKIS